MEPASSNKKGLITDHLASFFTGIISIIGSVVTLLYLDWQMRLGRQMYKISKGLQDASLDSKTEIIVQQALHNLMKGRTTLVIAYRLSTVVDADQILFMENGRITGKGTHEQLFRTQEMYREFATQQLRVKERA